MLNEQDSNLAMQAISNAAEAWSRAASQAEQTGYDSRTWFVLLKPRLFPDGNMWCALYGDDLQSGVAAFGETPAKAAVQFDIEFLNQKAEKNPGADLWRECNFCGCRTNARLRKCCPKGEAEDKATPIGAAWQVARERVRGKWPDAYYDYRYGKIWSRKQGVLAVHSLGSGPTEAEAWLDADRRM